MTDKQNGVQAPIQWNTKIQHNFEITDFYHDNRKVCPKQTTRNIY